MNDVTTTQAALTDAQCSEYAERITSEVSIDDEGNLQITDTGREFLETNVVSQEDRTKITLLIKDLISNDNSTEEATTEDEAPVQEDSGQEAPAEA